ncbi:cupin domain-containing protein [Phormidesmis priestleyi]
MTKSNSQNLKDTSKQVVTVRPATSSMTLQGFPYFFGISNVTAGSQSLCMSLVEIPAGGSAPAHIHKGHETAIYLLKGRVEMRYGDRLQHLVVHEAGDFIFIPPDMPHQPRNLSETESAQAIVARNHPSEQENAILYEPQPEP